MAKLLARLKQLTLSGLSNTGAFRIVSITNWRRQRLLILCYHGISLEDEHEWYPSLYLTPELFQARMETLERARCSVVSLQDGVKRLYNGDLPRKSVAISFDDGFYDFYERAFPVLRKHGYPVTVYQTTYYTDHRFPVINLMLDYLFWRSAGKTLDGRKFGIEETFDLSHRAHAVDAFVRHTFQQDYNGAEKDALAARVAESLGIDYERLRQRGILQLMTAGQLGEISRAGVDVEMHTHRHRAPVDEDLFVREIRDNREAIRRHTGKGPLHFCYPSGACRDEFLPWLREEGVTSATTIEAGLASPASDRFRLPRLLDTPGISALEFEGWLAGLSAFLPHRSSAHGAEIQVPSWESAPQRAKAASA